MVKDDVTVYDEICHIHHLAADHVTVYDEICHIHHQAADHVTVYDEICDFHHLIVRAVSKYRGFSQQLIGKSEEMPQNSTSCVIFSVFLDTAL